MELPESTLRGHSASDSEQLFMPPQQPLPPGPINGKVGWKGAIQFAIGVVSFSSKSDCSLKSTHSVLTRGHGMKTRRSVLAGGIAFVASSPFVATAQPTVIVPRIGFLAPASGIYIRTAIFDAFRHGLTDLGHIEGRSVHYEYRSCLSDFPRKTIPARTRGKTVKLRSNRPAGVVERLLFRWWR
jgi:hypothetical protein